MVDALRVKRDLKAEKVARELVTILDIPHVKPESIRVVRTNSDSRAYARVWGVNKILQVALGTGPTYVIELVEPKFGRLDCYQKILTLVHEIAHIPRTFSGYVRPHNEYFRRDLRKMKRALSKLSRDKFSEFCRELG